MNLTILDNLIIVTMIVMSFIAGQKLANRYHARAEQEKKDALERQFLRLKANSDADDPCKPYFTTSRGYCPPVQLKPVMNTGDYDGDVGPISEKFMQELKETGRAKTTIRKADIAK